MIFRDKERNVPAESFEERFCRARILCFDGPALLETMLLALVFAGLTWSMAPDVNESHYLVKAKHF